MADMMDMLLLLEAEQNAEGGGGGGEATLINKSISANGTYAASSDSADGYKKVVVNVQPTLKTKSIGTNGTYAASGDSADGYSSVTVNVSNSYAAGDEGKVVSSGALVSQSSRNIDANGTYDTTLKNQVVVNVQGGATGYQLLASGDYVYTGGEAASIDFPVSFDGTIKYWYCVADAVAGVNHSHAFMGIEDMPGVTNFLNGRVGAVSTMTSAGVVANNVISDNNKYSSGRLYLARANNTYKIQNSTYHWYIYGEV